MESDSEPETKTYFQRYLDVCFERICKTKLVKDVIILNRVGIPLRSTFSDREVCIQQAGLYASLFDKACGLISLADVTDEFLLLSAKTRHNEVVVSVDPEHGLVFVVVQKQPK
ncbi:AAEL005371-PA [Aedes aegypti]|uniref:AAEL005371-PA n=1 Tax=Aedes aegypti TaxID=7159 RepID=Q17AA1_AEDAE|nr:AAEL005371-PA [Aedes aegypti]